MFIKLKLLGIFVLLWAITPEKAHAYLDPGTGSMILQVIVASVVGIGCTLGTFKQKIIDFFKNIRNKNEK